MNKTEINSTNIFNNTEINSTDIFNNPEINSTDIFVGKNVLILNTQFRRNIE
jgi:hypothetical protein